MLISVKTKEVTLQDVQIGNFVLSKNLTNNQNSFCEVLNKFVHTTKKEDLRKININEQELIMSNNHPVWDPIEFDWIEGGDLTTNNYLLSNINSAPVAINDVTSNLLTDLDLIDLHVAVTNNYFAGYNEKFLQHNSATVFYPIWHYQFDDLIVLKNNQGTEENRVRFMDYGVVLSGFFLKRFKDMGDITLFDPNEVPELYEAFYSNTPLFEEMYVKYEKRKDIRKKVLPAVQIFKNGIVKERSDTGRIYLVFIDNVMNQGPFDPEHHPIYQSNLCCVVGGTTVSATIDGRDSVLRIDELCDLLAEGSKINVLSKNTDTGVISYKPVSAALKTGENRKVIKITDSETGKSITCTPDHKIFTKNRGWVEAGVLKTTDVLDLI